MQNAIARFIPVLGLEIFFSMRYINLHFTYFLA